jgi:transcription antitermination factor NusG
MHNWFAVQVWAGREQISATGLRARGYEVLLPCYHERRRWSDRIKTVERALFTGYLFCRLEATVFGKVVTTPGVIRIVGNKQGPLPVSEPEIEAIKRVIDAGLRAGPWPFFHVGQAARLEAGPLRGVEGTVLVADNRHRLILSVSLLQRSVAVEVEPAWVTPVPPVSGGGTCLGTAVFGS